VRVRRLLWLLHRDVGYFLFGLTLIYAVSGIAVNHIADWNPNYAITVTPAAIQTLGAGNLNELERQATQALGLRPGEVTGRYQPSKSELVLFLQHGGEARLNLVTGEARIQRVRPRLLIFESNLLHLNRIRGAWTYVADAFALLLAFLAISGVVMLKGQTGLLGRGKWLVAAGILVPLAFVAYYYVRP
jgi:uncharacterized protein